MIYVKILMDRIASDFNLGLLYLIGDQISMSQPAAALAPVVPTYSQATADVGSSEGNVLLYL